MTHKNLHYYIVGALIVYAFIILPTGTPEDLFTTVYIINNYGIEIYKILVVSAIGALFAMDYIKKH